MEGYCRDCGPVSDMQKIPGDGVRLPEFVYCERCNRAYASASGSPLGVYIDGVKASRVFFDPTATRFTDAGTLEIGRLTTEKAA